MKTSSFFKGLMLIPAVAIVSSCQEDEEALTSRTALRFEATNQVATPLAAKSSQQAVALSSFKMNIRNIEIEFAESDTLHENHSVFTDLELDGPFEIDLMRNGLTLDSTVARNIQLPIGGYDEIEFTFDKGIRSGSELFGKSILIRGTIHSTPFVFWTDEDFEVEIEFEPPVYLDAASSTVLSVSFRLASLFNPEAGGVDITSATDGNQDGTIEIHPDSPDGNSSLADLILDRIDEIIDSYEDEDAYEEDDSEEVED